LSDVLFIVHEWWQYAGERCSPENAPQRDRFFEIAFKDEG